jgi:hypothetical protein
MLAPAGLADNKASAEAVANLARRYPSTGSPSGSFQDTRLVQGQTNTRKAEQSLRCKLG